MKNLLIIDGNSIINRAFYGIRELTAPDGLHTNAIYGMLNIIFSHTDALSPDYMAAAFDVHAPTFRHGMFSEYKAGRRETPPELLEQFPYAKECLAAMGIPVLEKEGWEADDILGTLASLANETGQGSIKTYILTGDKDSLQLVSDNTTVLLAGNKETTRIDRNKFREIYGIEPEGFVDVKALMGDSSDNIPGVPGIGEKTALKLIAEFGSIEKLYEGLEAAKLTDSVKLKLKDGRESAFLSKTLAKIDTKVPLGFSLEDIAKKETDTASLSGIFNRLGFAKLTERLGLAAPKIMRCAPTGTASLSAKELSAKLKGRTAAISLDENALSFYTEDGFYIYEGDKTDIREVFEFKSYRLVCHDLKSVCASLLTAGIKIKSCVFDTMLAAYLLSPGASNYSLDALSSIYPPLSKEAAAYIYQLYKTLGARLEEKGETALLEKIELPTALVLAEMEKSGFKVDRAGLEKFREKLEEMEKDAAERVYFSAGRSFNINSPKQLGTILFEEMKLPPPKKTKSGFSTDSEVLEKLSPYHPIAGDILEYRKIAKLKSTYAIGLLERADENGRVHTSFNQCVTATGRLSSTEPNLQNIPIRTDLGRQLRRYFIPENENYVLIDADYSQIELRLLAHISGDENMRQAFLSGEDIHASTATAVFGVPYEMVTPELRKRAKAVNFGIVYGIGDFSLSQDLGITRREAKEYMDGYFAKYPAVSEYLSAVVEAAYRNGYVSTISGRRREIPELSSSNRNLKAFGERVAMNSPIQGSAADIIKIAMINVSSRFEREGLDARIILQVHDELVIEASKKDERAAREALVYEMENAVSLSVPLPVDVSVGENWYGSE